LRFIYSFLIYLSIPFFVLHLLWRGRKAPAYLKRWQERFGYYDFPPTRDTIWIHAVSVGEVQATMPIVKALHEQSPEKTIVITTTTPTGSQRVRDIFGMDLIHVYAPYDTPGAVKRFLQQLQPSIAVIMETEIWPNLFNICSQQHIPVILANARLSERSARGYHKIHGFISGTLNTAAMIAAQTQLDKERFVSLGVNPEHIQVTGSVKFDVRIAADVHERAAVMRREWGVNRSVLIAASTHEGEESQVLNAFEQIRQLVPNVLLVLVPRHPERFAKVTALCYKRGYKTVLRSEQYSCDPETQIFIGDTMGELDLFYAAADVAFVGGSLVPHGGQNPVEPAAMGLPVIIGPHMFNFQEIVYLLLEAGGAERVQDVQQLASVATGLLKDANLRNKFGERGQAVVESNRGAVDRLIAIIKTHIATAVAP